MTWNISSFVTARYFCFLIKEEILQASKPECLFFLVKVFSEHSFLPSALYKCFLSSAPQTLTPTLPDNLRTWMLRYRILMKAKWICLMLCVKRTSEIAPCMRRRRPLMLSEIKRRLSLGGEPRGWGRRVRRGKIKKGHGKRFRDVPSSSVHRACLLLFSGFLEGIGLNDLKGFQKI